MCSLENLSPLYVHVHLHPISVLKIRVLGRSPQISCCFPSPGPQSPGLAARLDLPLLTGGFSMTTFHKPLLTTRAAACRDVHLQAPWVSSGDTGSLLAFFPVPMSQNPEKTLKKTIISFAYFCLETQSFRTRFQLPHSLFAQPISGRNGEASQALLSGPVKALCTSVFSVRWNTETAYF